MGSKRQLPERKELAAGFWVGRGNERGLSRTQPLRGHAAIAFAALPRGVGLWLVSDDVGRLLVFAHALFAAAAATIIDAAYHPRFGGAGSKECEGEESDEPFHIWERLVWPEKAVLVKKNRREVGDSLDLFQYGQSSMPLEKVLTVPTTFLRFCKGDQKLPVKLLNRCQVGRLSWA
jgi:hypothetical protein